MQKAVIDLVIKSFKVVPAPGVDHSIPPAGEDPNPVQNRLSEAVIVFANEGNFPAGDFKLAWKPGPIFEAEQTVQINGLKYGESKSWTFQFIYRNSGEFNSTATVDSTNTVRESNEFNNSKTVKVVVEREQADLEIVGFEIVPSQPVQGIAAKAMVTIRNRGNTAAGPFDVEWSATQFAAPQRTQVVAGLGIHDTVQVTFDHTYGFAGQFSSTVAVDAPIGRVAELDETNNSASLQVTVQQATKNLVINDIQILSLDNEGCSALDPRSVTLVEPELDQNQDYFVCIKIQNLGNSPVGPFVVSWNPDTFNLSVPSLNTLTQQVDLIDPGAEMTIQFVFSYPQAGEFRSIAEVDAFKVIAETNEQDNLRILNVVVNATGPDLVITELEVQPYYGYEYEGDLFDSSGLVRAPEIIRDRETCVYNEDQVGAALARSVPPPYDPDYTAQLTEDQVARVSVSRYSTTATARPVPL